VASAAEVCKLIPLHICRALGAPSRALPPGHRPITWSDALPPAFGSVLRLPGGGVSRRPRAHPDRHFALRLSAIGISSGWALLLLLLSSLIGSYINIPIAQLPEREVQSDAVVNFFGTIIARQNGRAASFAIGHAARDDSEPAARLAGHPSQPA
jgi:hypothetical protein